VFLKAAGFASGGRAAVAALRLSACVRSDGDRRNLGEAGEAERHDSRYAFSNLVRTEMD
jgi:hypothetical protein